MDTISRRIGRVKLPLLLPLFGGVWYDTLLGSGSHSRCFDSVLVLHTEDDSDHHISAKSVSKHFGGSACL